MTSPDTCNYNICKKWYKFSNRVTRLNSTTSISFIKNVHTYMYVYARRTQEVTSAFKTVSLMFNMFSQSHSLHYVAVLYNIPCCLIRTYSIMSTKECI